MTFEEALTRSPIKTVRVSTRGLIKIRPDDYPIATPLIIRELPNGFGRAHYTDTKGKSMRFNLIPETYQRIKQECLKFDLHCKPLDE